MIRLRAKNPAFSGERAGIRFQNGEATVYELTGRQRQALAKLGIQVDDPNDLSHLTVRELREVAENRGVDLEGRTRKQEIIDALS